MVRLISFPLKMNLSLAKLKKQRHRESENPFTKHAPLPALLQTAQEGLPHAMRLEQLRKGNWENARNYDRQLAMTDSRKRYQMQQTHNHEYDKLRSIDHGLLQPRAMQRMEDLRKLLNIKDA